MYTITKITKEQELECWNNYQQTQNLESLELLFKSAYGIFLKYCHDYKMRHIYREDMIQDAYYQLVKQIHYFNPLKSRFSTFCGLAFKSALGERMQYAGAEKRGGLAGEAKTFSIHVLSADNEKEQYLLKVHRYLISEDDPEYNCIMLKYFESLDACVNMFSEDEKQVFYDRVFRESKLDDVAETAQQTKAKIRWTMKCLSDKLREVRL